MYIASFLLCLVLIESSPFTTSTLVYSSLRWLIPSKRFALHHTLDVSTLDDVILQAQTSTPHDVTSLTSPEKSTITVKDRLDDLQSGSRPRFSYKIAEARIDGTWEREKEGLDLIVRHVLHTSDTDHSEILFRFFVWLMAQPGYNSERQRQILEPIRDTLVEEDWDLHTLRSPDQMTVEI